MRKTLHSVARGRLCACCGALRVGVEGRPRAGSHWDAVPIHGGSATGTNHRRTKGPKWR